MPTPEINILLFLLFAAAGELTDAVSETVSAAPSATIQIILLIAGALGLREVIGILAKSIAERKRARAETDQIETQTQLENRNAESAQIDKRIADFERHAIDISAKLKLLEDEHSEKLRLREEIGELALNLKAAARTNDFLKHEIEHLEKTVELLRDELTDKNRQIVELRGMRQSENDE